MSEIGPVQVLAVGFPPGAPFEGAIIEELARLEGEGTIRVLDRLFVQKDAESGDLIALDLDGGENFGAIVGTLMGFEFEEHESPDPERDLQEIAATLEPGASAGILLVEHVWARGVRDAIRATGGEALLEGFLSPAALAKVAPEVSAMAEAMDHEAPRA
jgi:hypothetical protein